MTHIDFFGRPVHDGLHRQRRQAGVTSGLPGVVPTTAPVAAPTTAASVSSNSQSSSGSSTPAPTTAPTTASSVSSTSSSSTTSSESTTESSSSASSSSDSTTSSSSSTDSSSSASSTPARSSATTPDVEFSTSLVFASGSRSSGSIASPSGSAVGQKKDDDGLSPGATTAIAVIGGIAAFALLFWIGVQILQSKRRKRRDDEMDEIDFDPNGDPLHAALGIHRDVDASVSGHGHGGGSTYGGSTYGGGRVQNGNRDLAEMQFEDDETRREREAIYNDYMASIAPPPPAAGGLSRQPTSSTTMFASSQEGGMVQRQPTNAGMMYGGLQRQPTMGMGQAMGGQGGYGQAYDGFEGAYGGTGQHVQGQSSQDSMNGAGYGGQHVQGQRSLDSMNGGGGYQQHPDMNAFPDPQARGFPPSPPTQVAFLPNQAQQRDLYAPHQHYGEEYDPFANNGQGQSLGRSDSVGTAKAAGGDVKLGLVQH